VSQPTRRYHVPSAVRRSSLRISSELARELIADGAVALDVRRHEDESMPIPGSLRIPPDEIPARLDELPRDRALVLACT
jgi:rhodanese-related sulfurtransferase